MKKKVLSYFIVTFLFFQVLSARLIAQVIANFSSTPASGCAPLSVTFNDLSSGGPTSWVWNLGNGNNSNIQHPGAVYSAPGTYTITLVASKPGSGSTKTATVRVFAPPIANFTSSVTSSCVGKTITFTDGSSPTGGAITSWTWDFGDGTGQTTSTGTVTHSYSTAGNKPVTLIIKDVNGCTSSIIKSVTIVEAPVPAFTATPVYSCTAPLTVNFTNTSTTTGAVTYLWRFGDGTPNSTLTNPSHTYTASGTYKVTMIVTQGACIDSVVKTNFVTIQNIVANFSANNTSICAGTSISFTETSVPLSTSRTWDFGDGSPISTAANPIHTYTSPGTYTVSLLNATLNGCSDSEIKTAYITVHPIPTVNFSADKTQGCDVPFAVNFTDGSTNAAGWSWDFGDGSPPSASQNPAHVYNAPGSYSVRLIVTSAFGCVDTLIKPGYITITRPIANFTATPREGCVPLNVNFTSNSVSVFDPIVNYNWDFGNGTTTTGTPTVSRLYPATGIYNVRLIITTATGCKDTATYNKYIKVGIKPTANFNVVDSVICYGEISGYNNLSLNTDSTFWLWGDGSSLPLPLPALDPVGHLYADTGKFTVTLYAFNNGCADTLILPDIERILPPKPVFTFQLDCNNPYLVKFTDASLGADSITWDFGDGSPIVSDSLTPTHIYATRGLKTVTLTAYNFQTKDSCSFFMAQSFTIADVSAQYTAGPNIGCYPLPVVFTNTSQDSYNNVTWELGDGSKDTILSNTVTLLHTYTLPGRYPVKLIIADINGCMDSITTEVIVQGAIPDFIADTTTGCTPLPITFTDTSISDSALVQWKWTFGDISSPQTTLTSAVAHTYTVPGLYSVKMVVMDKNGCADSITKVNYIQPTFPVPQFTTAADTFACRNEVLTFTSTSNAVAPATYFWRFGDGVTASGPSATHSYASDNTYDVTLIVTDKNGCTDSIKHKVFVQHPVADFADSTISESCGFREMDFYDKSTGVGIVSWKWDFGDGATSISTTSAPPKHFYTVAGTYTVKLVVTNSAGCTDTVTYPNLIVVPGPSGSFTFAPQTGCMPLTVTFTATANNTAEYIWDFGDGTLPVITSTPTIQHTYTTTGTKNPQLILGNVLSNGLPCRLTATNLTGPVVVTGLVGVNIDSSLVKLQEGHFFVINSQITNGGTNPIYSWTPPTNLSCTDCHTPSVVGDGSGEIVTYRLVVTNPNGCIGYDSIRIYYLLCDSDAKVPNVFTPNDDGINDEFNVNGICEADKFLLQIYDRWGIELFHSETRNNSWDGRTSSGQMAPDGVYYYILNLEEVTYKGFLQLMR